MDNFIVSARKYRPATFHSVVGQRSITQTLKNSIKNNHLAHAYLFCGPRGVGKTTCARIFAKTINCTNITTETEPCNECESCRSFNENRSYNIHELDAASNNSVDDIRQLVEQVRVPPQMGTHSVYIIDEVHMLSQAAFNAFLKTLEEPPKHAIFILATTEKHKILPTIISRCQIFDFNRIGVEDAVKHLQYVAKSENVKASLDALNVIAQKADGAMRDALSLFDQVVSFSGDEITYEKTIENLNVLDYDYYFRLTDAFLASDIPEALSIFNHILNKGFDGLHFVNGLNGHFRDLMVCKDPKTLELLEVGASIKERYKEQSQRCEVDFLYMAITIAGQTDLYYKTATNQRLHVELMLLKLANILEEKKKEEEFLKQQEEVAKKPNQAEQKPDNEKNAQNKKASQKPKMPKLTDVINGKKKVVVEAKKEEYKKQEDLKEQENPFTDEDLKKVWQNFVDKLQKSRPRLASIFSTHVPEIKENYRIEIALDNKLQKEDFDKIKARVEYALKKELKNTKLALITVVKVVKNSRKIYSPQEKFEFLTNKNEHLKELQQIFNLDF